jgi:hypothetical protein
LKFKLARVAQAVELDQPERAQQGPPPEHRVDRLELQRRDPQRLALAKERKLLRQLRHREALPRLDLRLVLTPAQIQV